MKSTNEQKTVQTPEQTQEQTPTLFGITNDRPLNFREMASFDSNVLCVISPSMFVKILKEVDDFYKVEYMNMTGFVAQEFITIV